MERGTIFSRKSPEPWQLPNKSMNIPSNSQNSNQMPWWHKEKKDGLPQRISQIQKVNDPTTYTDEVLSASKILLTLLLCFSGVLGALSYFKNFSISFPMEVAVFLALTLTIVIEWGKMKAATWAVRIPFFQGWGSLGVSPANTFIFLGLLSVAAATFTMSIYNSTKGGEQLAQMLSHEKNASVFTPDTKGLDDQISSTQNSIANAPMQKWKGKMYYQDKGSVRAHSKSMESLVRQREQTIATQRADYERNLAIQSSQANFASKLVMASGGWIELLQALLILLRVACEKNLDGRTAPLPQSQKNRSERMQADSAIAYAESERKIGFNVDRDGNVRRAEEENTVTQLPRSVSQVIEEPPAMTAEEALRWFETDLRREPSNLQNKHANQTTVINRIHNKLGKAESYLDRCPDNSLPASAANRFRNYLEQELFKVVEYPKANTIIQLINQKSNDAA